MMPAYSGLYIERAQACLGEMLHYAVYDLSMGYDEFMSLFIYSGIAGQFSAGNPRYVVGMSGIELAMEVLRLVRKDSDEELPPPSSYDKRSDAYWTGYTPAWYQWTTGEPFGRIQESAPVSVIAGMYHKYHEMDIRQSVDEIDRLRRLAAYSRRIQLQQLRQDAGLSQSGLARLSGVPVRTIQQYEQGQKDISKAAFETVLRLSRALNCTPEKLAGL